MTPQDLDKLKILYKAKKKFQAELEQKTTVYE